MLLLHCRTHPRSTCTGTVHPHASPLSQRCRPFRLSQASLKACYTLQIKSMEERCTDGVEQTWSPDFWWWGFLTCTDAWASWTARERPCPALASIAASRRELECDVLACWCLALRSLLEQTRCTWVGGKSQNFVFPYRAKKQHDILPATNGGRIQSSCILSLFYLFFLLCLSSISSLHDTIHILKIERSV